MDVDVDVDMHEDNDDDDYCDCQDAAKENSIIFLPVRRTEKSFFFCTYDVQKAYTM